MDGGHISFTRTTNDCEFFLAFRLLNSTLLVGTVAKKQLSYLVSRSKGGGKSLFLQQLKNTEAFTVNLPVRSSSSKKS